MGRDSYGAVNRRLADAKRRLQEVADELSERPEALIRRHVRATLLGGAGLGALVGLAPTAGRILQKALAVYAAASSESEDE